MTEETMLLSLRAETLRANLTRLQEHLASDPKRLKDLKGLEDSINIVKKSVSSLRRSQLDLEDGERPQKEVFRTMNQQLDLARDNIETQLATIERMKDACFRVLTTSVGGDIQQRLNTCTAPLITELGALDRNPADLSKSWKDL